VKVLALTAATPLRLMTIKPVKTLADLKGMKIKTSGDMIAPLKVFGAAGLGISMAEAVEGMIKGIMDGVFCNVDGYKSMKLADIVKYETENLYSTRGPNAARGMNWDTWNRLPPDVQKVFEANKEWWSLEIINMMEKGDIEGRELANKAGVQIIQLPASEVKKLSDLHESEDIKMAQQLDKKGLHATKLYSEARRLLKAYSAKK
jgi:TRAP-type C4-dicarboxylate transport system substrate-binding protein